MFYYINYFEFYCIFLAVSPFELVVILLLTKTSRVQYNMLVRTVYVADAVTVTIVEAPHVDLVIGSALPPTHSRFLLATISCDRDTNNSGEQGSPSHPEDDLEPVTSQLPS